MPLYKVAASSLVASCLLLGAAFAVHAQEKAGEAPDETLFDFKEQTAVRDWTPVKLPELEKDQPVPRIEIVPATKSLKITFRGGEWPTVGTTKIPVKGNWKGFQTLKANLTVDRACVAYFRMNQGKADDKQKPSYWESTMILQPGRNEVTLMIRHGIGRMVLDPRKGDVSSFLIGMFKPQNGQSLLVENVRLSPAWPPPKVLGWYSPYNHDGYSMAVAREYKRTGKVTKFKVLGTDLEVDDFRDLAMRLKNKWTKPEAKTIEQVEADFKAEFQKVRQNRPRAVMAVLRNGETGWQPTTPGKVYDGWKMVYLNSHGPNGPNRGREQTPALHEDVEVFMRHRSVLMQMDLSSIPKGAAILAARLVVTRTDAGRKPPEKANLWVAEPCNRDWDASSANCYFYARGKHWKAVNGLYYGQDPDFWPVFVAHGPAGGGVVSAWDFTHALKFWLDDKHPNHGFFLHGDSVDYMRMYTQIAKDVKRRPALMVVYDPK